MKKSKCKKVTMTATILIASSTVLMPFIAVAQTNGDTDEAMSEVAGESIGETTEESIEVPTEGAAVESTRDSAVDTASGVETLAAPELPNGTVFAEGDFTYTYTGLGNVSVSSYIGQSSDIVIPGQITHLDVSYDVISIDDHAMSRTTNQNMPELTSVVLSEGIWEIDASAFENNNLTSLDLPSSMGVIYEKAFSNDTSNPGIKTITGGENVVLLGDKAFQGNQITDISSLTRAYSDGSAFIDQKINVTGNFGDSITFVSPEFQGNITTKLKQPNVIETFNGDITTDTIYAFTYDYEVEGPLGYSATVNVNFNPEEMQLNLNPLIWNVGYPGDINQAIENVNVGGRIYDPVTLSPMVTIDSSKVDANTIGEYPVEVSYDFGGGTVLTGSTTVSVVDFDYTINFDANGGEGTSQSISAKSKDEITMPKSNYTKFGYSFVGWSTDPSATKADYKVGDITVFSQATPGSTITLYAVWEAETTPNDPSIPNDSGTEPSTDPSTKPSTDPSGSTGSSTSSSSGSNATVISSDPGNSNGSKSKGTGTSNDPANVSESSKKLPSTGEERNRGTIVVGMLAAIAAVGLWVKRNSFKS